MVDDDTLTLNPPELAQRLPERVEVGPRKHPKKPHPRHLSRLLRLGSERRGEEAPSERAEERPARGHWMMSSARPSRACGMVSPSALAVLRLITTSHLLSSST